jgi:hypothetical protein
MRRHVLGLVLAIGFGWFLIAKLLVTTVPSSVDESGSSLTAPSPTDSSVHAEGVGFDDASTASTPEPASQRSPRASKSRLQVLDALTGLCVDMMNHLHLAVERPLSSEHEQKSTHCCGMWRCFLARTADCGW